MKLVVLILLVIGSILSLDAQTKVDMIVTHTFIYTVNQAFEKVSTMIINQGKIVAVGGDTLLNQYQSDQVINAEGQYVYPGFIDAHCHFTGYAMDKYKIKLFGMTSFSEILEKLKIVSLTNSQPWIEGVGWDQNLWKDKNFPTKEKLDKLFPNIPVFLLRVDGHAALVNQKAIELSMIKKETSITGGEILKMNGTITGILIDNAIELVKKNIPLPSKEESLSRMIEAQQEFFKLGLTGIVECGIKKDIAELLQVAYQRNQLSIRSTVMLVNDQDCFETYLEKKPFKSPRFHIAGFKLFADGSLGSRGAFLLNEYHDRHHHQGQLLLPIDSIRSIAQKVLHSDYQLCVHAIGDATNRDILDIYSKSLKSKNDRRWRIEHAQMIDHSDMHYFGNFCIIPSVQPTHATSDMKWVKNRIGITRTKRAYAYKELLKQNDWLPLGTDFPVEGLNPIHTFYAAVFRRDSNYFPVKGFQIENALTREQALRGITIWAAKSVFEENEKGSLESGKYADFVILNHDIMKATPKQVYHTKVIATYLNGELVYSMIKNE
jgi:predicted amidohydrolase YtcJ